jgi:hypothetical protein
MCSSPLAARESHAEKHFTMILEVNLGRHPTAAIRHAGDDLLPSFTRFLPFSAHCFLFLTKTVTQQSRVVPRQYLQKCGTFSARVVGIHMN